jgi:hypothetical protein
LRSRTWTKSPTVLITSLTASVWVVPNTSGKAMVLKDQKHLDPTPLHLHVSVTQST